MLLNTIVDGYLDLLENGNEIRRKVVTPTARSTRSTACGANIDLAAGSPVKDIAGIWSEPNAADQARTKSTWAMWGSYHSIAGC